MTAEQARIEYLKKPENVALAHEICELFPRVEMDLANKMWSDVQKELKGSTRELKDWTWKEVPQPGGRNSGIFIRPAEFKSIPAPDRDEARLFVQVALAQESPLKGFFIGVACNRHITASEKSRFESAAAIVIKTLIEQDYKQRGNWGPFTYVGWKYVKPKLSRGELLRSVATDRSVARELVAELLGLFYELRNSVEELNLTLRA